MKAALGLLGGVVMIGVVTLTGPPPDRAAVTGPAGEAALNAAVETLAPVEARGAAVFNEEPEEGMPASAEAPKPPLIPPRTAGLGEGICKGVMAPRTPAEGEPPVVLDAATGPRVPAPATPGLVPVERGRAIVNQSPDTPSCAATACTGIGRAIESGSTLCSA